VTSGAEDGGGSKEERKKRIGERKRKGLRRGEERE